MTLTKAMRALGATALAGALLLTAAPTSSADQVRDAQWANSYFGLDKVWSVGKGDGVIVAVIDTGVDASHPDLAGSVLEGYDPSGTGANTSPTDNHGTSMASLIVGHGHGQGHGEGVVGLAPGAKVLPIYRESAGGGDAIPDGIRWAVEHNAKVINISQGRPGQPKANPELTKAVAYAAQHDVLVVVAAGNDGVEGLDTPANEPGVLAVGAVDKTGTIWSRSNYGPQVLLSAPGADIVSGGACGSSQYCMDNGTSDATAYVSAAAALVRAKFPKLTAGQVANRLVKSAKAPGAGAGGKLPDPHYGYGILSPYDALTKDIPTGSAQGPLAAVAGTGSGSGSGSGSVPSAGATAGGVPNPDGTIGSLPAPSHGSSSAGAGVLVLGIGAVLVLLVVVIAVVVARSRRRPAGVPPQGQPYGAPNQPYGQPYGAPNQPHGAPPNWQAGQQPYGGQYPGQAPPAGPYPPQYGNQAPPVQPPQHNPYGPNGNPPRG